MKNRKRDTFLSYAWSSPSLLLIALMVVFPIFYTAYISLTNMNVYHWFDFTIIGIAARNCICAGKPTECPEAETS